MFFLDGSTFKCTSEFSLFFQYDDSHLSKCILRDTIGELEIYWFNNISELGWSLVVCLHFLQIVDQYFVSADREKPQFQCQLIKSHQARELGKYRDTDPGEHEYLFCSFTSAVCVSLAHFDCSPLRFTTLFIFFRPLLQPLNAEM